MKFHTHFILALTGLTLFGASSAARAAMILTLSSGLGGPVSITDNGLGDGDPTSGEIFYYAPVGNFSTSITTSTSNSPGSDTGSILQITSIEVVNNSASPQTLTITLGDTGFSDPNGNSLSLGSSFSGTFITAKAGDSASFQSFADPANGQSTISGPSTALQSFTLANATFYKSFNTPDQAAPFSANTYSLTNVTTITLSAGAQANISGSTIVTATPEPTTLILLSPIALTLLARRRRSRAA